EKDVMPWQAKGILYRIKTLINDMKILRLLHFAVAHVCRVANRAEDHLAMIFPYATYVEIMTCSFDEELLKITVEDAFAGCDSAFGSADSNFEVNANISGEIDALMSQRGNAQSNAVCRGKIIITQQCMLLRLMYLAEMSLLQEVLISKSMDHSLFSFGGPPNSSHCLSSYPQSWPSLSYGDVYSLSSVTEQDKLNGFCLQGDYLDIDANTLGIRSAGGDEFLEIKNFATSASMNLSQFNEGNSLKNYMNQSAHSLLQCGPSIAGGGCNGAGKPRARARRGQATDPHSIAERLRREKIAEKMKNLFQILIRCQSYIEMDVVDTETYGSRCLLFEVRLVISNDWSQGSNGPLLLPLTGQGATHSKTSDNIAFEQEVVKLMESNISKTKHFLQTEGLCLMPTAFATAISGIMPSSASVSTQRNKMGFGTP
ncbi:hypothetical protein GIB67_010504, partial [Kingdonia uniflora]